MIHLQVLDHVRRSADPVSCTTIANALGVTTQSINKYLRMWMESGDLIVSKEGHTPVYLARVKAGEVTVLPRHVPAFKPLVALPSALGTRDGSNDHLQYKSKHF